MFSDLQRIDMGIAMCHFEAVCKEFDLDGRWKDIDLSTSPTDDWEYILSWG